MNIIINFQIALSGRFRLSGHVSRHPWQKGPRFHCRLSLASHLILDKPFVTQNLAHCVIIYKNNNYISVKIMYTLSHAFLQH